MSGVHRLADGAELGPEKAMRVGADKAVADCHYRPLFVSIHLNTLC
jgi:hypothetical protein